MRFDVVSRIRVKLQRGLPRVESQAGFIFVTAGRRLLLVSANTQRMCERRLLTFYPDLAGTMKLLKDYEIRRLRMI